MNDPTTLQSLSDKVNVKVSELSTLLKDAGLPEPSFAEGSHSDFAVEKGTPVDDELRKVRNELIDAAKDIVRLAMGPVDQILSLAWSASDTANINIINTFSIAQHVPSGSSISISELSAATGLPEDELQRTVRYAITNGIFVEPTPGLFAHSAASAALSRNSHLRNICNFNTDFVSLIQIKLAETLKLRADNIADDKPPHAAFNVAYRTQDDLFEYFHKETDLNKKYHEYLMGRVNTHLWSVDRLIAAWDWSALGDALVVDCGGSSGHSCISLAPVCPKTKFLVQDMNKGAMEMGRDNVEFLSSSDPSSPYHDLSSRITFAKHDFFTEQQTVADVYIFRHILHDWNDDDSVKIVKALVPALEKKITENPERPPRVLISEGIVPAPPEKRRGTLTDKMIRIEDSIMLAAHNARERSVQDFDKIFTSASPRFSFVRETSGTRSGAFQSLLEFEYK